MRVDCESSAGAQDGKGRTGDEAETRVRDEDSDESRSGVLFAQFLVAVALVAVLEGEYYAGSEIQHRDAVKEAYEDSDRECGQSGISSAWVGRIAADARCGRKVDPSAEKYARKPRHGRPRLEEEGREGRVRVLARKDNLEQGLLVRA